MRRMMMRRRTRMRIGEFRQVNQACHRILGCVPQPMPRRLALNLLPRGERRRRKEEGDERALVPSARARGHRPNWRQQAEGN